jgi:zinc D-Ala-D-Ala carboxypeptidase
VLGAPGAPGERSALGEADGAIPDGTTVFDNEIPGVANLDPALLGALRQAATDAAGDGVEFHVDSGWRSPEYQEQLLHAAVLKYGSEVEASRWVAAPSTSAHV